MVSGAIVRQQAQFSVGQVFACSFRVMRRNFFVFAPLAIIFRLIWLLVPMFDRAGTIIGDMTWTDGVAKPILGIITAGLIEAAVAFGTLQGLEGNAASWSDAGRGLRSSGAVALAGIIFSLPEMAVSAFMGLMKHVWTVNHWPTNGLILVLLLMMALAIPLAMIAAAWFVYGPAIVFERKGAIDGLTRSAELTSGHRWAMFGIGLLFVLIAVAALLPVSLIADVRVSELLSPTSFSLTAAIAYLIQAVLHTFSAVLIVVSYCFLRAGKESLAGQAPA